MTYIFAGSAAYAFGGNAKIALPAGGECPVGLPSGKLVWEKNAAKTTSQDGTAFAISLAPTGGWYDKVVNLQNYYLNREFAVSSINSADDLPAAALASGYSFSTLSSPNDLGASFVGNSLTVPARKLVKNMTTGLSDFGTSVNPWNTTVKFNRATGLVSGTFSAWEWIVKNDLENAFDTAQKQITGLAHKGVLLYSRGLLPDARDDEHEGGDEERVVEGFAAVQHPHGQRRREGLGREGVRRRLGGHVIDGRIASNSSARDSAGGPCGRSVGGAGL